MCFFFFLIVSCLRITALWAFVAPAPRKEIMFILSPLPNFFSQSPQMSYVAESRANLHKFHPPPPATHIRQHTASFSLNVLQKRDDAVVERFNYPVLLCITRAPSKAIEEKAPLGCRFSSWLEGVYVSGRRGRGRVSLTPNVERRYGNYPCEKKNPKGMEGKKA